MKMHMRKSAIAAAMLAGLVGLSTASCKEPTEPLPDAAPDTIPDAPRPDRMIGGDCDPTLSLERPMFIGPTSVVALLPTGGTGDYLFEVTDNQSGGSVHPRSGDFLSGSTVEVVDTITVTDDGCDGSATLEVRIVANLQVTPSAALIAPEASFTVEAAGGSGSYTFSVDLSGSGGSIDPMTGVYTAGPSEGRDIVALIDTESGEVARATYDVQAGAGIRLTAASLALAPGSTAEAPASGGTEYFSVTSSDSMIVRATGSTLEAVAPGEVQITVRDRFTGESALLPVTSMTPASLDMPERVGNALDQTNAVAAGDLNGDGFEDLVIGIPEADSAGERSGSVFVYAGNATGFDREPVQILDTGDRDVWFGWALEVRDINADGEADLIVTAPLSDVMDESTFRNDVGKIVIHHGVEDSFFDPIPAQTLRGVWNGDQTGQSLAICDFNADGLLDIAAGAPDAETREGSTRISPSNSGVVQVYFGRPSGFPETPDQHIVGEGFTRDGTFTSIQDLRHGRNLEAGDFNGDGACDLAVMTRSPYRSWSRSNDGAVLIYEGISGRFTMGGGLATAPTRALAGRIPSSGSDTGRQSGYFALSMTSGDINGDGRDDLFIGHSYWDDDLRDGSAWADRGAVYLFLGQESLGSLGTSYEDAHTAADSTLYGWENGAFFGRSLHITDLDSDGAWELLVGSPAAEEPDTPNASKKVHQINIREVEGVWQLVDSGQKIGHDVSGARFGHAITAMPDPASDSGMLLATIARYDSSFGKYVGAFYSFRYTPSDDPMVSPFSETTRLGYPGGPSGAWLGNSADVVGDLTGDGLPDLVVGAPETVTPGISQDGLRRGSVVIYQGTATGFDRDAPVFTLQGQNGQGSYMGFGYLVSRAGDFNGDGLADFAVHSRDADRRDITIGVTRGPASECGGFRTSNPGTTSIYLQDETAERGFSDPAFIYYGSMNNFGTTTITGGFDHNGDGYDEVLIGSWQNSTPIYRNGRTVLIYGRPAVDSDPSTTHEICSDVVERPGLYRDSWSGHAAVSIGDIDADGCDELAIGHARYGTATSVSGSRGAVDIVFGWSTDPASPCPSTRRVLRMVSTLTSGYAGTALASGSDVDGDGLQDLVVTGRYANSGRGRAWVVSSGYILDNEPTNALTIIDLQDPSQAEVTVGGQEGYVDYGYSTALLPNVDGMGNPGVAIGARLAGQATNGIRRGLVEVHRLLFEAGSWSIEERPWVLIPGETSVYDSRLGRELRSGEYGSSAAGGHTLIMSSPFSRSLSSGMGTAWTLQFP